MPFSYEELLSIPDYYNNSNLLNINEITLIRWLEIHYEIAHPTLPKRFKNLDSELKDCLSF